MWELFVIDLQILSNVLNYLPLNELLNSRLVCQTWNGVVIQFYSSMLMIQLKTRNNSNNLAEYIQIASNSVFCSAISNVRLSIQTYSLTEKVLWEKFFERFGNKIKSLTLSKLNKGVVELIFSNDILKFLINLTELNLNVSLEKALVAGTTLSHLLQLENLTITATGDQSEYGQMEFLSKFLKHKHKLKSLALVGHFCVGELPLDILPNLFKTNTIESLDISSQVTTFLFDAHFKSIKTRSIRSTLKNIKFDQMRNVSSTVFHRFLVSQSNTLERITISAELLLNDFPTLNRLTHLKGSAEICTHGLSFCNQFSNLKDLRLNIVNEFGSDLSSSFKHYAMRSLYLKCLYGSIDQSIPSISRITSYFPNLINFEICHNPREILPQISVSNLHHQIRYVCESSMFQLRYLCCFSIYTYREHGRSVWTAI